MTRKKGRGENEEENGCKGRREDECGWGVSKKRTKRERNYVKWIKDSAGRCKKEENGREEEEEEERKRRRRRRESGDKDVRRRGEEEKREREYCIKEKANKSDHRRKRKVTTQKRIKKKTRKRAEQILRRTEALRTRPEFNLPELFALVLGTL